MRFIRQAQRAGFTLAEIQSLVQLREDHSACCRDVKAKIIDKKRELEARIEEMKGMARSLGRLIAECDDDTRPVDNCPILAEMRHGQAAGHGSAWQRRAT